MLRFFLMVLTVVILMPMAAMGQTKGAGDEGSLVRVGTYDSRIVALAYYRSTAQLQATNKKVEEWTAQRDQAKQAGDMKKVAEIEAKGKALQELKHDQVFYGGPIENIMKELKPALPEIAKAAGVEVIVSGVDYQAAGVKTVDVTDAIVNHIGADEKTRTFIKQMKEKPVLKKETTE